MFRRFVTAVTAGVVILLGARAAQAELITFAFTGGLTQCTDPNNVLGGGVTIDDSLTGTLLFESNTPDSDSNPTRGSYEFAGGSLVVQVGNLTIQSDAPYIRLGQYFSGSDYTISAPFPIPIQDFNIVEFYAVRLTNMTVPVFADDDLPSTPPDLSGFPTRYFWIQGRRPGEAEVFTLRGDIETLTLVPEPASFLLMCAVIALVNSRRVTT